MRLFYHTARKYDTVLCSIVLAWTHYDGPEWLICGGYKIDLTNRLTPTTRDTVARIVHLNPIEIVLQRNRGVDLLTNSNKKLPFQVELLAAKDCVFWV